MSQGKPKQAPDVNEIERRFRSPAVVTARPVILGGLAVLATVRRFKWTARGAARLVEHGEPLILASNQSLFASMGMDRIRVVLDLYREYILSYSDCCSK